jgi:NADH-quinone oxidoreductase subunit L
MAVVLVVLALGSIGAGYLGVPAVLRGSNLLEHFLRPSLHVPALEGPAGTEHLNHATELLLMGVSSVIAIAGIGLAVYLYVRRVEIPERLAARFPAAYQFLLSKGYIDELYDNLLVQPVKALSEHVLWKTDSRVIDGAVNGTGRIVIEIGAAVRQVQTGSMRTYAVSVLLGAVVIVGYYLWS